MKAEALKYAEMGMFLFPCHTVNDEGACSCGVVDCQDAGKHPRTLRGLKDASNDPTKLNEWFGPNAPPSNLAIATGAVSGVTVIDIDMGTGKVGAETWAELIREHGDPVTLMAKTGSGGMHVFFAYNPALKTGNNRLGKHVDVKNDGGYIIAAPSRHRSGGAYEWVNWGTALAVLPDYLLPHKKKPKPKVNPRSYSLDEVKDMLTAISAEDRDRWRAVGIILGREFPDNEEAFAAYHEWADTWGGTKGPTHDAIMKEAFYEIAKQASDRELTIATIVHWAREAGWVPKAIAEMNKTYAVVFMGGDCKILREHMNPDTKRIDVSFLSERAVKLFHANAPLTVGVRRVDRVDYWIDHRDRRTYKGLTFLPGPTPEGYYNLWRGFAVEPKEGDCSLMLAHIEDVIAAGNAENAKYMMVWLANVVQQPTNRPGVAVVMRGGQGIGKGQFAKHFGSLFLPHFAHLTKGHHLIGHFNSPLKDALVVFADEAFWAGDKQGEGALNALITEETHLIELKGIDPVPVKNFIHLIVASNHEWVVPAGRDARRFFVLDVAEHHKEDHAYFKALTDQMDNGGREAFLYYLQHYTFTDTELRRAPKTAALSDQKIQSLSSVEEWWYGCLKDRSLHTGTDDKPSVITASGLYYLYVHQAKEAGVSRRATEMKLSKTLRVLAPGMRKYRRWEESYGTKQYVSCLEFPPLAECRAAFDKRMNWTHDWTEGETDVTDVG